MKKKEDTFTIYYALYQELILFIIEKVEFNLTQGDEDSEEEYDSKIREKNCQKLVTELNSKGNNMNYNITILVNSNTHLLLTITFII